MIHTKYVFRQDAECLRYAALGDTAVRILALHHWIRTESLDALIVPQPNPRLLPLWQAVFGAERVIADPAQVPDSHIHARVARPTPLDWGYGSAAWTVFESVLWENGYFRTDSLMITPPIVFRADHRSQSVMIYPAEGTDGNRVYTADWWIAACQGLRKLGWRLNLLGGRDHGPLKKLFSTVEFDKVFVPTIEGLRECVAASSCAIGGSSGPTWVLLMSDIRQVVLESKRSPHGYWFFDRCQTVLSKRLQIAATLDSAVHPAN